MLSSTTYLTILLDYLTNYNVRKPCECGKVCEYENCRLCSSIQIGHPTNLVLNNKQIERIFKCMYFQTGENLRLKCCIMKSLYDTTNPMIFYTFSLETELNNDNINYLAHLEVENGEEEVSVTFKLTKGEFVKMTSHIVREYQEHIHTFRNKCISSEKRLRNFLSC